MNTANQCYCMYTESQFSMKTIFNYRFLLFLTLNLTVSIWFIQSAAAQNPVPTGTLELVGPTTSLDVENEFEVSVKIVDPQNVNVFTIRITHPRSFGYRSHTSEFGTNLTRSQLRITQTEIISSFDLALNIDINNMNQPNLISEGILFTVRFQAQQDGNYRVKISEEEMNTSWFISPSPLETTYFTGENIAPLRVLVGTHGTFKLVPAPGIVPPEHVSATGIRDNETSFIDIELIDRLAVHRYEITVDLSDNLELVGISYNTDDTGITPVEDTTTNSVTLSANILRANDFSNDPDEYIIVTHVDRIVATLFFKPTAAGEESITITDPIIYESAMDTEGIVPTLEGSNPFTFTVFEESAQVTERVTGPGPTPIIKAKGGTQDDPFTGPFEVAISFVSDNVIQHVVNADASILVQRGVYGFARDEVMVSGAGASVTTRLWEADGAQLYYARVNPTETGLQAVEISVPAGVATEVGTNLLNVASETVTVYVQLDYPPWDVNQDNLVDQIDLNIVGDRIGQGLEDEGWAYINTIEIARTDVNGDLYVTEEDVNLVRMHIPDDGGVQGRDGTTGQEGRTIQGRSIVTPPDASVWMPDENLRREMRRKFDITDDRDLTQARMTHLTSLGFRNEQISDITGLEYAINLTELVFRNTQISDLEPLKGLTSLSSMKLVDNNITDITPLSGLTNLTFLNISGNNISDLTAIAGLTNLTELWATDNDISDITALANLTNLQKLRLRDNPILDTSPLYSLTQGVLQDVDITISQYPPWDVNEDGNVDTSDAALVTAALGQAGNAIADPRTDVNGDLSVDQTDVDLVRMYIPDDVSGQAEETRQADSIEVPHVSVWMPDGNLRRDIRKALGIAKGENFTQEQVATLTKLTADKARISDITGLEHATSLRKLDLRRNQISDIGSLEGLTELTDLKIGTNNISDITAIAGLTELTHIGLSENEISNITALENLTNLTELWLRVNNINDITALENLTRLTRLNLEENGISDITGLGNLTQLTYLNLRGNEISDITALGNLTNLKELWMADNNISNVSPLSNLTKLKKLGLANNPILDTSPLYPLTQGTLRDVDITVSQYPPWDVNEDGSVDATDSALVTAALGQTGAAIADPRTDVNGDGTVDQNDLTLVTDNIGTDGGAPSNSDLLTLLDQETLKALDRSVLASYLNTLRAESDGSLKYLRAIALLEHILAMTRPKQTQLLANYPNPFNPETWIPYHLANPSDVQITIYDARGTVVRRLDLGHQKEGYYTHRSRAAFWDGRNGFGERVASGIYFYQLQADNISSLRKLLILK